MQRSCVRDRRCHAGSGRPGQAHRPRRYVSSCERTYLQDVLVCSQTCKHLCSHPDNDAPGACRPEIGVGLLPSKVLYELLQHPQPLSPWFNPWP